MDRIKLTSHVKKGDTLYTPYTVPDGLGKSLRITSWSKSWLPEFLWIGLIINELGRKDDLEQLYKIINDLQENKICVSHFSKIIQLDMEKRKLFLLETWFCTVQKKNSATNIMVPTIRKCTGFILLGITSKISSANTAL